MTTYSRQPCDGPIEIKRDGNDIVICAEHNKVSQNLVVSEWNARRLLGALSVVLGLPLTRAAAKTVQM